MNKFYKVGAMALMVQSLVFSSHAQDVNSFERETILSTPRHIAFADMNKDGIQDMVGVNGNTNTDIEIYLGTGNSSFELSTTLDGSSGLEYYKVFLEDLNSDDFPDIIAVSDISGIIFLSDSEGDFSELEMSEISADFDGNATLFEDFNEDNNVDLFYNRRVHLNNSDGSFTAIDHTIPGNGGAVAFDYNIDENLDLIVANPGIGKIQFFTGDGNGNFSTSAALELDGEVDRLIHHDFNNDGLIDIIVNDFVKNQFIIHFNDESHLFTESTIIDLNHNFYTVLEIGDFDLDGSIDIIGSDDANTMHYWSVAADESIGERQEFETGTGTIREFYLTNAIGENFVDLVIVSGFGNTYLYSDKLNAEITQIADSKEYDNLPFLDFYELSVDVNEVSIDYEGFEETQSIVGNYSVSITVADDTYEGGAMFDIQITKRPLTVTALDATIFEGESLPEFELAFENFANGDDVNSLISLPIASTNSDENSPVGGYDIVLSGGEAINYSFELVNGILTIEMILSISKELIFNVYPNPANNMITVESNESIQRLLLMNLEGKIKSLELRNNSVDISNVKSGLYLLYVQYKNGTDAVIKLSIE